jgi:LAS superfamily LD-carboxypeptidase LdcB
VNYIALIIILIGIYLIDSGIKNRAPIGFLVALLAQKSPNLQKTLEEFDGKWQTPLTEVAQAGYTNPAPGEVGLGTSNDPRNGKLPASALTKLSWSSQKVANGAASSMESLNRAYRAEFGTSIQVTDGYRTYAQQVATKAAKGHMAATPGQSNHGLGLAVDLGGGINNFGTKQYDWMLKNAPNFGWVNPTWAQQSGSKPEPWHWEFVGGAKGATSV